MESVEVLAIADGCWCCTWLRKRSIWIYERNVYVC